VRELYSVSLDVVVLAEKLAVDSADCKIVVGVVITIIIITAIVASEPVLSIIQYWGLALRRCCHHLLLVNTILPSSVFALGKQSYTSSLKRLFSINVISY